MVVVNPNDRIYQPGDAATFCSHGADSQLMQHDGVPVTIVRQLEFGKEVDEEVGVMWKVKTADGKTFDVFADELDDGGNHG